MFRLHFLPRLVKPRYSFRSFSKNKLLAVKFQTCVRQEQLQVTCYQSALTASSVTLYGIASIVAAKYGVTIDPWTVALLGISGITKLGATLAIQHVNYNINKTMQQSLDLSQQIIQIRTNIDRGYLKIPLFLAIGASPILTGSLIWKYLDYSIMVPDKTFCSWLSVAVLCELVTLISFSSGYFPFNTLMQKMAKRKFTS